MSDGIDAIFTRHQVLYEEIARSHPSLLNGKVWCARSGRPHQVDAAKCLRDGWATFYYGGSSIFSFTLTDEASCKRANKPYESPARYQLAAPDEDEFEAAEGDEHI